jgi:hypothetical protein
MISFPLSFLDGRRGKFFLLLVVLSLSGFRAEAAPPPAPKASQVKAAFLFNFAKFVEWPPGTFANDQTALVLGFYQGNPMAEALEALQGKVVQGRRLEVKRCREPEEAKQCQIFFASASEKLKLPRILGVLRNSPVLTVTDEVDDFAQLGGIINLIIVEDKIRFEICLNNAGQSGLKISSQLLKLAKTVID